MKNAAKSIGKLWRKNKKKEKRLAVKSLSKFRKSVRKILKDARNVRIFLKKNPKYKKKLEKMLRRFMKRGQKGVKGLLKRGAGKYRLLRS